MIEPTITGCFKNPWKNLATGLGTPAGRELRRAAVVGLGIVFLSFS